jgi:GGDEF domain-containing protein
MNILKKLNSYLGHLLSRHKTSISRLHAPSTRDLSPEKQLALRTLCEQLFKKREVLTSGKLQLIGLENIKKKMGKRWQGLCNIVYETTENVIKENIGNNDLFIRYTDDTYVIIFANTDLAASEATAHLIAKEVRRRLFLLDEAALREIEIRETVKQTRTDTLSTLDFSDFLDAFVAEPTEVVTNPSFHSSSNDYSGSILKTEIEPQAYKPTNKNLKDFHSAGKLTFSYMPLWDVKRGALTTYACFASQHDSQEDLIAQHKTIYQKLNLEAQVAADLQILAHIKDELSLMEAEQRKLLVVCPVRYETLFGFDSYEAYKESLLDIPLGQRQFLILLILRPNKELSAKDAYWFLAPLKGHCRLFFTEVPLKQGVHYQTLKSIGLDGIGICIDKDVPEQQVLAVLNSFSTAAKSHKIAYTFVLGVSSLSLTTSSVCAGFDYLGGSAIHDPVTQPDTVHKFRHENIVSALLG